MEKKRNIIIDGKHGKPILADIFYEECDHPKAVIIFSHGFKGFKDWGPFNLMAEKFAMEDFIFLKFNFSHNGTTPEHPDEFGDHEAFGNNNLLIELDDLSSMIDFVSSENFYSRFSIPHSPLTIHLIGHSRGGAITILKGAEDPRVNKIVALAPVNRFGYFFNKEMLEQWKRSGVHYELNSRTGQQMPMYYQYWETMERNHDQLDIPATVKTLAKPLLIIHGRDDETIPFQNSEEIHEWNKVMTQLFIIDHANHTFNGKHPWPGDSLPPEFRIAIEKSIRFLNLP